MGSFLFIVFLVSLAFTSARGTLIAVIFDCACAPPARCIQLCEVLCELVLSLYLSVSELTCMCGGCWHPCPLCLPFLGTRKQLSCWVGCFQFYLDMWTEVTFGFFQCLIIERMMWSLGSAPWSEMDMWVMMDTLVPTSSTYDKSTRLDTVL